ncbi:MAG: flagellar export protein FliJ [Planctomycetes bacterium]|nr:flagellar export protein FliJ [Planctomycetota bacterium]
MRPFTFRLQSLLKYRRHRRDLRRQLLAQVQADLRRLRDDARRLEQAREKQLNELRELSAPGAVDIDRAAARRYHAGRLQGEIFMRERQQLAVAAQVEMCRQALVQADREVRVLERLEDRQREDYRVEAERRATRELDELWHARLGHT